MGVVPETAGIAPVMHRVHGYNVDLSRSASQSRAGLPSVGVLLPFSVLCSSCFSFSSWLMRLRDGEPAVRGGRAPDAGTDSSVFP